MDLEDIKLSEIIQRKTNSLFLLTYGIQKTEQTTEYNKKINRFTDIENKLMVSSGTGMEGGGKIRVGN